MKAREMIQTTKTRIMAKVWQGLKIRKICRRIAQIVQYQARLPINRGKIRTGVGEGNGSVRRRHPLA